jgi:hypothetical protein
VLASAITWLQARLTGSSWPPWPPPQSAGRHRYGESGRGRLIDVSRTFLHQDILGVSPSRLPPQGASGARQGRVKALATGRTFLLLRGSSVTEPLRLPGTLTGRRKESPVAGRTFDMDKAVPKMTAAEKDALAVRAALANAIEDNGVVIVDDAAGFPDGITTVSKEQWRAAFEAEDTSGRSPDALRVAFNCL